MDGGGVRVGKGTPAKRYLWPGCALGIISETGVRRGRQSFGMLARFWRGARN